MRLRPQVAGLVLTCPCFSESGRWLVEAWPLTYTDVTIISVKIARVNPGQMPLAELTAFAPRCLAGNHGKSLGKQQFSALAVGEQRAVHASEPVNQPGKAAAFPQL